MSDTAFQTPKYFWGELPQSITRSESTITIKLSDTVVRPSAPVIPLLSWIKQINCSENSIGIENGSGEKPVY